MGLSVVFRLLNHPLVGAVQYPAVGPLWSAGVGIQALLEGIPHPEPKCLKSPKPQNLDPVTRRENVRHKPETPPGPWKVKGPF